MEIWSDGADVENSSKKVFTREGMENVFPVSMSFQRFLKLLESLIVAFQSHVLIKL